MNRFVKIGVGLLAVLCAGAAGAYPNSNFRGTVVNGFQDYSDEAFRPLAEITAKMTGEHINDWEVMESYAAAMMRIIRPNGPLAGVRVALRSASDLSDVRETTTDANGQFYFNQLEIGDYGLTVSQPVNEGEWPEDFTWRLKVENDGRHLRAELMLPTKFIQARGQVTDTAGQPLTGIRIQAFEYRYHESGRWSPVMHVAEAVTDEQGRYELPGLHPMLFWPGDGGSAGYVLKVEGDGFVSAARKVDVVMPETQAAMKKWAKLMFGDPPRKGGKDWRNFQWPTPANEQGVLNGVDFTLFRPASLGGSVQDTGGTPVTNAWVGLRYLDAPPYQPMPFSLAPSSVQTDDAGRFFITGLATGHYDAVVTVESRRRDYRDADVELHEGEVQTNLALCYEVPPTGRIEASVFERGSAKPISTYTASVERVDGPPDSGMIYGHPVTDPDKPDTFTLDRVSPGTAHIRISAPGYVTRKATCEVESGKRAILPIELEPAGAALVRVTRNGVVTRPYQLMAYPEGSANAVWGWSRRIQDDGRCEIQELPSGLNRIQAEFIESGQHRYCLVSVPIEAGKTNTVELETEGPCSFDLDLTFPTNAKVRAWVKLAEGPKSDSFEARGDLKISLWASESSRIAVTNLPAGDYRAGVQKLESTKGVEHVPKKADQMKSLRLEEGQRPAVAFEF